MSNADVLFVNPNAKKGIRLPKPWIRYTQLSTEGADLPNKYLTSEENLAFRDKAFEGYFRDLIYIKMIEEKFGLKEVKHMNMLLSHKIHKKLLEKHFY